MLNRLVVVLSFLGIVLTGSMSLTQPVSAETLVQSTVENRLVLALSVAQMELQKWLPAPWQVNSPPIGPLKGANLYLVFIDRLLVHDPQGKPDKQGYDRYLAFAVPAKNMQTGETAVVVIRRFHPNDAPGPYKNGVLANVLREQRHKEVNLEAAVVDDSWEVRDAREGMIKMTVEYQRTILSRSKSEQKIYSSIEPNFFRIYRVDSASDIVKSVPMNINRVKKYQLRVTAPEFKKLFDGTEQLIGISVIPSYVRQIFLP